jgi:hypothetical protein
VREIDKILSKPAKIKVKNMPISIDEFKKISSTGIVAYDNAGNYMIEDNNGQYYIYTVIPEFPSTMIPLLFILLATLTAVFLSKKREKQNLNFLNFPCAFPAMRLYRDYMPKNQT